MDMSKKIDFNGRTPVDDVAQPRTTIDPGVGKPESNRPYAILDFLDQSSNGILVGDIQHPSNRSLTEPPIYALYYFGSRCTIAIDRNDGAGVAFC
jgi:hypothetical protein